MPTHAEDRLIRNVLTLLSSIPTTVAEDRSGGMERTAQMQIPLAAILKLVGLEELIPMIPQVGAVAVASAAFPYVVARMGRDWAYRELGNPEAGVPLPHLDIRHSEPGSPRGDDNWWDRDRPNKIGEVAPSFYLENSDYEPWYIAQQAEGRADYGRDVSGLPATFQTMPGYLFRPKVNPRYPITPSDNAFDMYDSEASPLPVSASGEHGRTVMAQQGTFSSNPRAVQNVPGTQPFSDMFTPTDDESAASLGAYEGWYAPGSKEAPFLDPAFAQHGPAEWQGGKEVDRIEMNKRRQQALQQQQSGRMGEGMNWQIGDIFTKLKGGRITREKATQMIWTMIDMLKFQGLPDTTAQQILTPVLQAIQSGQAGGLPDRLVGGMGIPERPTQESMESISSPTDDPMRNQMIQYLASQRERMQNLSPGYGPQMQGYTAGGGTMF